MLPYLCLILIPICLQHIKIKNLNYQAKKRFVLKLFLFMLFIVLALRHEQIGNDTRNYSMFFGRAGNSVRSYFSSEPGFGLLMRLVDQITDSSQLFFAIVAMICVGLIAPTYNEMCEDAGLTIILYCILSTFPMMFSGLRQMIAIGVGFIAFRFVRERRIIPFLISVLAGISFHNSAFMLLFMYPLYHAKITKKWLYVVVPIMALVFVFNRQIFLALSTVASRFSRFDGTLEETGAYLMIVLFGLFCVFSYVIPNEEELDADVLGMRNFLLFATAIQLFAPLNTLVMRLNYYYIIFIPLLLPRIIKHRKARWGQVALLARHIMVVCFMFYFFVNLVRSRPLHIYPYHFFWEKFV